MCTLTLFFILFVALSLQAGIPPAIFAKDMNKIPSQHVAPCNGNGGYPLPTRARIATEDTYPGGGDCKIRNAIAFEDPTHSRSDGAKAPIAIHIRILVLRGRPPPLGLSPRRMWWQFCTPRNFLPCNVSHTIPSYLVYLPSCGQGQIGGKPSRPTQKGKVGCTRQPNEVFKPSPFFSKCFSSLAWVTGQGRSLGRGFGTGRHSKTLQEPPCAQHGRVFGKCLPRC